MEENDMKIPKNLRDKEDLVIYKKMESPKREKKRVKIKENTVETDEDEYSVSLDELL